MEAGIRDRSVEAVLAAAAVEAAVPKADLARRCDAFLRRHYGRFLLATDDAAKRLQLIEEFLELSIQLGREELVSKSAPVLVVVAEALETSPVTECAAIFALIEARIDVWTQPFFFEAIRNHLLRVCNQLLRRLSRTLHTELAGRILIFLARTLPLTERSGLNLIGSFNLNNKTLYQEQDDEAAEEVPAKKAKGDEGSVEEMEEGEMDESASGVVGGAEPDAHASVPVDHQLYVKFWQLQEAFSQPNACFDKLAWKTFQRNANDVLQVLSSYKLERPQEEEAGGAGASEAMETEALNSSRLSAAGDTDGNQGYFAKYLTSKKLLQLQLNDSTFRRYALIQFLILGQYLEAECKFKDKRRHVLDDQAKVWLKELESKCYSLLGETYPDGPHLAASVRSALEREEKWNGWKNSGCKDVTGFADAKQKMPRFRRPEKRLFDPAKREMGNAELTRLWNYQPDTMAFCRSAERDFTPKMGEFLEDPWEQADPANGIEEGYKLVRDEAWRWSASRFLLEATPAFFTTLPAGPANAQISDIPAHIEKIILNVAGEMPKFKEIKEKRALERAKESAEAAAREEEIKRKADHAEKEEQKRKRENEEVSFVAKAGDEGEAEGGEEEEEEGQLGSAASGTELSEATLSSLAGLIAKDWRKLAKELDVGKDTLKAFGKGDGEAAALSLLQQWSETRGAGGSAKALRHLLLKAELFDEAVNDLLAQATKANTPDNTA